MTDDLGPTADLFFEANEGWGADALTGTRWRLVALDEGPIATDPPPGLEIGGEGEIGGLAGCNRFRGQAIIGDATISIGPLMLTRMLCSPAVAVLERAYLSALESASTWRLEAGTLELSGEDGVVRLLFRRADAETGA